MIVRCWGARGSLPVSGPEYLKYGGSTACMEIRTGDGQVIIVDAGTGIRKLGNSLISEGLGDYHMLFTHVHWDHILGFPFFKPVYGSETKIRLYGCSTSVFSVRGILANMMVSPYFPVDFSVVHSAFEYQGLCDSAFRIGSVEVSMIPLSHPNGGLGYKFTEDGKSFVFLTDNELSYTHSGGALPDDYVRFCRGADLLIHDSEYRPEEYERARGWGHSTFVEALDVAMKAEVRNFWLYHHNVERDDTDLDRMIAECREIAASRGASAMTCEAASEYSEMVL